MAQLADTGVTTTPGTAEQEPLERLLDFIATAAPPASVCWRARAAIADTSAVCAAGVDFPAASVIRDYVLSEHGGSSGALVFDGRRCSATGAALALGQTIECVDAHDSLTRRQGAHLSAGVLAALFAVSSGVEPHDGSHDQSNALFRWCRPGPPRGQDFVEAFALGVEVSDAFALLLEDQHPDEFVAAGRKLSFGAVAALARLLHLPPAVTEEAMGIVEVQGVCQQSHRGLRVTMWPSMLRDLVAWGAMAAVSAVSLAARGFTGAPWGLLRHDEGAVDAAGQQSLRLEAMAQLGRPWALVAPGMSVKAAPCCRWAQAPVRLAHQAMTRAQLTGAEGIEAVEVHLEPWAEALSLEDYVPSNPDQANYAVRWPVAAQLRCHPEPLGPRHCSPAFLADATTQELSRRVRLIGHEDYTASDPRCALVLVLRSGQRVRVGVTELAGREGPKKSEEYLLNSAPEDRELGVMTEEDLRAKCLRFASFGVGRERAQELWQTAMALEETSVQPWLEAMTRPLKGRST